MLYLFQSFQCVSRNRIAHQYHSVIHNSKKGLLDTVHQNLSRNTIRENRKQVF